MHIVDPASSSAAAAKTLASRPRTLEGVTSRSSTIRKPNAGVLLERVGALLVARGGARAVRAWSKPALRSAPPPRHREIAAAARVPSPPRRLRLVHVVECPRRRELEARGVPCVVLGTDEFIPLAKAQVSAQGLPGLPVVTVPHPIGGIPAAVVAARPKPLSTGAAGPHHESGPGRDGGGAAGQALEAPGDIDEFQTWLMEPGWATAFPPSRHARARRAHAVGHPSAARRHCGHPRAAARAGQRRDHRRERGDGGRAA